MPLFKSRDRTPTPPPVEDHQRKGSIFHRRSASSDVSDPVNNNDTTTKSRTGSGTGFFGVGGRGKDPSITAAREKLRVAEEREKAADQALLNARQAVAEAREHARRLELEAEEE